MILSSYLLLYSPGEWLTAPQTQAVLIFYLLTNATLYFVAEDYFSSPYFYGPLLLFDTIFLSIILGISGGTTPDLYVACFFTVILSCICNDLRGLLVITFLAPLIYGYVVFTGTTAMHDPSIYLRLPLPLVISIFYGYFAQVERLRRVAREKGQEADKEQKSDQEIRRRRMQLEVLHETNAAVIANTGLPGILDVFLEKLLICLPFAAAVVRLRDPESGTLETVAAKGFLTIHPDRIATISVPPVDEVINKEAVLTIKNLYEDARIQDIGFLRNEGFVGFLGFPLRINNGIVGSLAFFTRWDYEFTDEEMNFVSTAAAQLAIAIQNRRLCEQVQRHSGELREAHEAKDEFLGVVSQVLKTPLKIISGYSKMLSEGALGPISTMQEKALQTMTQHSKELHGIVDSVLQVSCIESNLVKPDLHGTNFWEFLYDLKSSYQEPLEKDVKISWDFPPELPALDADRGKLKQVLQNVIDNAIKFTERGTVKVSARYLAGKKMMEFEINDTGIGIPPEQVAAIFQKFRRLDNSQSQTHSGIGLGLYIAKKIVDMLGGTIDVRSKPGEGSTFIIRIPTQAAKSSAPHEQLMFPIAAATSETEVL